MSYRIVAVRYATRETTKSDVYYRYRAYGEPDGPRSVCPELQSSRDLAVGGRRGVRDLLQRRPHAALEGGSGVTRAAARKVGSRSGNSRRR